MGSGGAEKLVVDMCNYLSNEGHNVGLYTFISDRNFFENILNKNVSYYKNSDEKYFSLKKIIHLYKVIKQYDIVHVHLFPPFYIVAFLSFFLPSKRFIYTEHNTFNNRRKKVFKLIEKVVYSRYSKITCISEGVKKALEDWMPINKKTILINNFVKIKEISREETIDRTELGFLASDKIIAMVGSFRDTQKDQDTLIKSLRLLPSEYKLILIGEGILKEKKVNYVKEIGLRDRVIFLGGRKDVYSVLKTCDYGVLSSNWEGFGIVVLEYMACGLPAIGTNVEGLNEVITEKECLFEVGDVKRLADIILSMKDKVLKENIIRIQQERLRNYDINVIMNNFIEMYKKKILTD